MLSFIKSNSKSPLSTEVYIYGDKSGLLELKSYIDYLLDKDESSIHLSDGNELEPFSLNKLESGFSNVVHVKIINVESEKWEI